MKQRVPFFIFLYLSVIATVPAEVKPNALFSDHAVLQQGVEVPVWGKAKEGEKVTVSLADQAVTTTTQGGKWMVRLKNLKSGGPYTLSIKGENTLVFQDILVGESWICSGQSNMERQLGLRTGQQPLLNWEQEVASANYPQIRHFAVARKNSDVPLDETEGNWEVCSPQTVPNFTAVGYYFGRDLHRKLQVPIGLIHSSWGGTPAEAWTRSEILSTSFPEIGDAQKKALANYPAALEKYKAEETKLLADWEKASSEAKTNGAPAPRKPAPPRDPATNAQRPSNLYNAMIAPIIPYAIRGVIWYQGEANASRAKQYQTLFPAMIADWRTQWGGTPFPFLFVQIAPFKNMNPEIREAQLMAWKKTPATAMVVTADVGDENDIHPNRKEPVGARLALAARALAYGESIEYSGPLFESVTFNEGKALLSFSHTGTGLLAKEGALQGFEIAGADHQFYPAQAIIEGKSVVVSHPQVSTPTSVRYGWANVPKVNLFNQEGLPASPFRTDDGS